MECRIGIEYSVKPREWSRVGIHCDSKISPKVLWVADGWVEKSEKAQPLHRETVLLSLSRLRCSESGELPAWIWQHAVVSVAQGGARLGSTVRRMGHEVYTCWRDCTLMAGGKVNGAHMAGVRRAFQASQWEYPTERETEKQRRCQIIRGAEFIRNRKHRRVCLWWNRNPPCCVVGEKAESIGASSRGFVNLRGVEWVFVGLQGQPVRGDGWFQERGSSPWTAEQGNPWEPR